MNKQKTSLGKGMNEYENLDGSLVFNKKEIVIRCISVALANQKAKIRRWLDRGIFDYVNTNELLKDFDKRFEEKL